MYILVVDDEKDIRNLLQMTLEENGYDVVGATNGKEALEMLKQADIQLAIVDVMMPVMDGFNLVRTLREFSPVPVIFLTSRSDEMDKVLGLSLGADDYLAKPFSVAELLARVKAILRRVNRYKEQPSGNPDLIKYGNLAIDKATCTVYKDGKPLELGAKEYKMLLYFMERPERVFTKKQLYYAVWEDDYLFDDNTIMVHISRLRSRIEDDPQNPQYLKTIRGIGYKLHYTGK
jgi:DNA-binding response OmpR family regulator